MNIKSIAAFSIAAIAFTGLGTGIASAQSISWDSIAQCESGGDWHINTGNGYYGGLQFSESTWLAYGGGQYAGNAAEASKSEQISIAEKVLAGQGISAWPVCGVHAYDSTRSQLESEDQAPVTPAVQYKPSKTPSKAPVKSHKWPAVCPNVGVVNGDNPDFLYMVQKGDWLANIAAVYGVRDLKALEKYNTWITNPNLIYPNEPVCIKHSWLHTD